MSPTRWLPLAAVAVVLPFLGKAPALDEESYLWLAAAIEPLRPYDWSRVWPPFDVGEGKGFVYAHPPLFLWWMAFWWKVVAGWLAEPTWLLRIVAGVPWVALYAWATARLATRTCRHAGLACGLWLTSGTVG